MKRVEVPPRRSAAAELRRAIADLERGRTREALSEASLAAVLDPDLHARALVVARMCIRRQISDRTL